MTPDLHPNGMNQPPPAPFNIGEWRVNPASNEIARNGDTVRLDERSMRLLLCLAERPGEIVSIDELLDRAWAGVAVSQDSVYQAVKSLRRILGDDTKSPKYIATIPRLGYRMVAKVTKEAGMQVATEALLTISGSDEAARRRGVRRIAWLVFAVAVLCGVVGTYVMLRGSGHASPTPGASAAPPTTTIAVLPILDLTPGMKDEEFADGITEELIDKLSKVTGFQVPPPTSSFALKNKQISATDAARALGVAYVLDGSVRKSGTSVRVDVRLIRASSGFIVWSETYDQPESDILTIQDDIANQVTAALKASVGSGMNRVGKQ
jgi:TolB-like protein/DNA-binding winged helix-turn-helix (wHTH) protein